MPSLSAKLRRKRILERLEREGALKVRDLAREFGVSQVTIRADLAALEREGRLVRTRGGALPPEPGRFELPLWESQRVHLKEKAAIGRYAAGLVEDGETIFVDVGSTTTEFARALSPELKDVLVVTNALNIALLLEAHPGVRVVVTGGTLRALQHSLVNPFGTRVLEAFYADKAFLGANGIHPEAGVTNANVAEAEIKRVMVTHARSAYVLADHSKLLRVATARFATLAEVTALVTDDGADPEAVAALERAGLEVLRAGRRR